MDPREQREKPGQRILIVEDELLLAMDLEAILEEHGFEILEPVRDVEGALKAIADERPDVVTLDMNLDGESSAPIAAQLVEQNIPFVLLSGYTSKSEINPVFKGAPLVRKPFDKDFNRRNPKCMCSGFLNILSFA